jgi:DNA-binding IclR family transcriptional regulator
MTDSPAVNPTTLAPLRVMQLVGALAASQDALSLSQLSSQLGVPKSSLLSLLRTLASGGYVEPVDGSYRLGQEAFALGALIARSRPFPDNLRPLLARLNRQCSETVLIAVPGDNWTEVVYVDLIESEHSLRFKVAVGSRDPLYCTALGLAMLAFAPQAIRETYVATARLKRMTAATITSRTELAAVLARTRSDVLAVGSGINENVTAIAAPIFGVGGDVVAAVGLAGLSTDVKRQEAKLAALVRRTGEAMSRYLGSAVYPPGQR